LPGPGVFGTARSVVTLGAGQKNAMQVNAFVSSAIPRRALDDLNWLRGLAAVAVLSGHVRSLFFLESTQKSSTLGRAAYFATGLGHQAVIVFFTLSGFFIGTSVVGTGRNGTWSWSQYTLRRLTRLYVVLLPALLLTAAWDSLGVTLFGLDGIYGGRLGAPWLRLPDVAQSLDATVLLGNLAFLQDLAVVPFGSNGPLWSLSYEFWAYCTFPLLFRAAIGNAVTPIRVLSALAGTAAVVLLGGAFRLYFSIWVLGAIVAIGWNVRQFATKSPLVGALAAGLFTMAVFVGSQGKLRRPSIEDFALGAATAVFIAGRLAVAAGELDENRNSERAGDDVWSRAYSRYGAVLAGFSYTLYATHYPVVTFFQGWLVGGRRWTPDPARVAFAVLFGLGVMAFYAYPLSRLTEAHTDEVRRRLERSRGRPPATS
jgi:peptidoglycan/LPS O-acetylase OafA/YrhL